MKKISVYAPNGIKLKITANIDKCPLCDNQYDIQAKYCDEEEIKCICNNCLLEFSYFSLRRFIMINGFGKRKYDK